MSIPAHIVIVTKQPVDRYEFMTDGTVCFDKNNTSFIEYVDNQESVTIGINDDTVTITRFGNGNNYSMFAKEGACEFFTLNNIPLAINTTRIKTIRTDSSINAIMEYYFSHEGKKLDDMAFEVTIDVKWSNSDVIA